MANWASTSYRIEGKQEDLKTLNELINEFMDGKRPVMEDNASKDWEGNVALELGENTKGYYLRGFIQTCELEDDVLSIEAEEAWGATDFRHILEKHFEGMKVYFIVEEEGGEVYATNDKEGRFFDYRFLVDSCVDGADEWEYFDTKEQALSYVARRMGVETLVGVTCLLERSKMRTSSSSSNFCSMVLSVGWEMLHESAAFAKLRKRLIAMIYLSCCRFILF